MTKKIRIGTGSGGCSVERLEPACDLIYRGNIDYLIFECLSERTMAEAQKQKLEDPALGYNSMLEIRMRKMLKPAFERHIKIVSNMGAANPEAAVARIRDIAGELGLHGLKIARVFGDDITDRLDRYGEMPLYDTPGKLKDLPDIISGNVYLGADGIRRALDEGADVVITGRVADPSLFVGPVCHELGFTADEPEKMGQAILLGHLMECNAQITGGYFADPGYKDLENIDQLGFPIAEMDETGAFTITKLDGTGGAINKDVCKEQLLYEIGDPSAYITPDGIADFSKVRITEVEKDKILLEGARAKKAPDTYKVNIGYYDSYMGIAEISFGGLNSLKRARLVADAVQKRWETIGVKPLERHISYIGYNSLYGDKIAELMSDGVCPEVRLRIAVRTDNRNDAVLLNHEVQCLYINGAAGNAGIEARVSRVLAVNNILIPKNDVEACVRMEEVS